MNAIIHILLAILVLTACAPQTPPAPIVPAIEYTQRLRESAGRQVPSGYSAAHGIPTASYLVERDDTGRAQLRPVSELKESVLAQQGDVISNELPPPQYQVYDSVLKDTRDYNGPLSLGDPGVTASLWRETRGDNDMFRDHRAWKPMDLVTIVITEDAEGSKEAEVETTSESTVSAAISQLFSFDDDVVEANPGKVDPTNLISATTTNEFTGEGETTRKDSLKARISAMVAEVLPSGVIRIEGEKIISVNQEEQIMVISGLVRIRDINSDNEVDSSKIANMRIDYYGKGIVSETQYGGWLGRIMRVVWPF